MITQKPANDEPRFETLFQTAWIEQISAPQFTGASPLRLHQNQNNTFPIKEKQSILGPPAGREGGGSS
jgi:hypothetical protein